MAGLTFSRLAAGQPNESHEGYCPRMRGTTSRHELSCSTSKWLRFPFGHIFLNCNGFNNMDFIWLARMASFGKKPFCRDPSTMNIVGIDS
jgi:hypothetical protein